MLHRLKELLDTYYAYDPAAKNRLEILVLYPGIKALFFHRIAHWFYQRGVAILPRFIAEFSRWLTLIEIHPGAQIGHNVIIDHGAGTVIGETAIIGNHCIIYQGVTLGGTNLARTKRHPTLEDHVVVGAGAKVLGNITIGHSSRIGANSVVINDIPANATAVGIPAIVRGTGVQEAEKLHHHQIT